VHRNPSELATLSICYLRVWQYEQLDLRPFGHQVLCVRNGLNDKMKMRSLLFISNA